MASIGRVGLGMVAFGLILMVGCNSFFPRQSWSIAGTTSQALASTWVITAGVLLGGGVTLIWFFPNDRRRISYG